MRPTPPTAIHAPAYQPVRPSAGGVPPARRTVEPIPEFEPVDGPEVPAIEVVGLDEVDAGASDFGEVDQHLERRRSVTPVVAAVASIVAILILLAILSNRGLLPDGDGPEPTPLTAADLTAPELPTWRPDLGDEPPTSIPGRTLFDYVLSWRVGRVFAGFGGSMLVNVTNKGSTDAYVDRVRFLPDWDTTSAYATGWGRSVPAGEEVPIGLIAFDGPASGGPYTYKFTIEVRVHRLGTWLRETVETSEVQTMEVLSPQQASDYPTYRNDPAIYKELNRLVRPNDIAVVDLADRLSAGLGANYSAYWLGALFDWVTNELIYTSDPSDDDIWSPPGDTLAAMGGDCEDYSILISSVIEHWGGNSRFYVITKHAFAAVYLGPPTMDTASAVGALTRYYGTSARYAWFVDELGYWAIADGTSSQYLGGLPYNGVATDTAGAWDISPTEYLYVTDVVPGVP